MISVRKAGEGDAEGITDVLKHADFLKPAYRTGEKLPDIRNLCGQGAFWLAEQNGQVVSVIMVTRIDVTEYDRRYFDIPILVTHPDFRRRGLARRLLCKVMVEAATLDVVSIGAYAENEKSADLLKSEGFCAVEGFVDNRDNQRYELRRQSQIT
jgi:N-acetylglutamate synthase-like GNAT family acetyltransferase